MIWMGVGDGGEWSGGVELLGGQVDDGVSVLKSVVGNAVFVAAKAFPSWVGSEKALDGDGDDVVGIVDRLEPSAQLMGGLFTLLGGSLDGALLRVPAAEIPYDMVKSLGQWCK